MAAFRADVVPVILAYAGLLFIGRGSWIFTSHAWSDARPSPPPAHLSRADRRRNGLHWLGCGWLLTCAAILTGWWLDPSDHVGAGGSHRATGEVALVLGRTLLISGLLALLWLSAPHSRNPGHHPAATGSTTRARRRPHAALAAVAAGLILTVLGVVAA